jgi:hypothetical protein
VASSAALAVVANFVWAIACGARLSAAALAETQSSARTEAFRANTVAIELASEFLIASPSGAAVPAAVPYWLRL